MFIYKCEKCNSEIQLKKGPFSDIKEVPFCDCVLDKIEELEQASARNSTDKYEMSKAIDELNEIAVSLKEKFLKLDFTLIEAASVRDNLYTVEKMINKMIECCRDNRL